MKAAGNENPPPHSARNRATLPLARPKARGLAVKWETPVRDEEQERTVGLLLLGKGAVLAHGFDRPLAVEMDDFR
jgi:hypothetical protein